MCSIAGYISSSVRDPECLSRMLDTLEHRGPDDLSQFHYQSVHMGMTRLAINDIYQGQQPLYNRAQTVAVFYNGEIYNYPQLRSELESKGYTFRTGSDGEVICHLYDEYGDDLFGYLDGMFAISLWDYSTQTLLLARDLAGEKPLYYTSPSSSCTIVYASEIKAIRRFKHISLTLNNQAIWDFPTFLWVPEPNTIFSQVYALPKGHLLKVQDSEVKIKPYDVHLPLPTFDFSDEQDVLNQIRSVVEKSVVSRLLSDVPIGCFLSGGLDSSIVTSIASRHLPSVDTFSVSFDQIPDPYHGLLDESVAAQEFASFLGVNHHSICVTASSFRGLLDQFCYSGDQPFAVSSGLGILSVAQEASAHGIKVLLSGDCADECFGGYSWYQYLSLGYESSSSNFNQSPISFQNFGISLDDRLDYLSKYNSFQRAWAWHYYAHESEKRGLFSIDFCNDLRSSLRHFESFSSETDWSPKTYIDHDRSFYMSNEMLTKLDRMTMAYSIEGRVPFASPAILSLASQIPFSYMVRGSTLKWALRNAFKDHVPASILNRPKHGFNVPIDHWLRSEWSDLLAETFSNESAINKHGFLSTEAASFANAMLYDDQRLNGHSLFCYIMLNRWLEQSDDY